MLSYTLLNTIHHELVCDLEREGADKNKLLPQVLRPKLIIILNRLPETANLPPAEREEIINNLLQQILGWGPLENLLNDSTITEIMVNGPQAVYVERAGKLIKQDLVFFNEAELLQIINRIVSRVGRRIDESSPMVDARLPDGSRVNAIIAPLSRVGPVLTIRRFPAQVMSLANLVEAGTLLPAMANFLRACVAAKQNIIISGSTGAGKTSTLNALAAEVGPNERLITIEDTAEIRLNHPHLVRLEARPQNIEGAGEITIRTLLKNSLRMRPDRIIVGEVRGGEALDMLQAMNVGHQGSLTTVHANSPEEALLRLETMAMMADIAMPLHAIREQIKSAVHYVVQQERLVDGSRKIVAISEMALRQNLNQEAYYIMRPLFYYNKAKQQFVSAKTLPERIESFEAMGVKLDLEWFI